ncbi:MAG: DUF5663 domain-containing protein [Candidatus Paceibacterota bacterium]
MNTIPDDVLQKLGLERLSAGQREQVLNELSNLIENRLTADLLDILDAEQAEAFKSTLENGSDEEVEAVLRRLISENKDVAERSMKQSIKEFTQLTEAVGL